MYLKNIFKILMDIHVSNKSMIYNAAMFLFCIIYSSTNAQIVAQPTLCPGCAEAYISTFEFRRIKIEMIKAQILVKLRMENPPNISQTPAKLPTVLLNRLRESNRAQEFPADENIAKTMEMIILPEIDTSCHSRNPSACLRFNLTKVPRDVSLKSAELWVHKKADANSARKLHTFTVTPRNQSGGELLHKKLSVIQTYISSGWLQFPLRHSVHSWIQNRDAGSASTQKLIRITCRTCQADSQSSPISHHGEHRPFLMIHLKAKRHRRSKRTAIDCVSGLRTCCRERIRFSFKEIGWKWVHQPEYYDGYYCKGSCYGSTNLMYKHTLAIQQLARPGITSCCAPSKLLPMSILYFTEDGHYKFDKLNNMMVEKCGCA